MCNIPTIDDSN